MAPARRAVTPNRWVVLGLIAASGPLSLLVEAVLRRVLLGAPFEEVREYLAPTLTPVAWALAGATVVAVAAGLGLQRWLLGRALRALDPSRRDAAAEQRAGVEALYLATSVPQVPALLATLAGMAGAAALPVVIALAISAAGVLLLGVTAPPPR